MFEMREAKGGAISSFLAHSPSAHCLSQIKVLFSELLKAFFLLGNPPSSFTAGDSRPMGQSAGWEAFCEVNGSESRARTCMALFDPLSLTVSSYLRS